MYKLKILNNPNKKYKFTSKSEQSKRSFSSPQVTQISHSLFLFTHFVHVDATEENERGLCKLVIIHKCACIVCVRQVGLKLWGLAATALHLFTYLRNNRTVDKKMLPSIIIIYLL